MVKKLWIASLILCLQLSLNAQKDHYLSVETGFGTTDFGAMAIPAELNYQRAFIPTSRWTYGIGLEATYVTSQFTTGVSGEAVFVTVLLPVKYKFVNKKRFVVAISAAPFGGYMNWSTPRRSMDDNGVILVYSDETFRFGLELALLSRMRMKSGWWFQIGPSFQLTGVGNEVYQILGLGLIKSI